MVMRKYPLAAACAVAATALLPAAAPAKAQMPCRAGDGQAILVSVDGFKERTGTLRVLTFAGAENFANGRPRVSRIEVPVPQAPGPVRVCVPVPAARDYAVSVRHDINGNGESDRADGGGFSNNPRITLGQVVARRNPDYERTRIDVARGDVQHVGIVLNYLRGLSIGPVRAGR